MLPTMLVFLRISRSVSLLMAKFLSFRLSRHNQIGNGDVFLGDLAAGCLLHGCQTVVDALFRCCQSFDDADKVILLLQQFKDLTVVRNARVVQRGDHAQTTSPGLISS